MVPVATVGGEPGGRGPAVVNVDQGHAQGGAPVDAENQDLNGEQKEGEENTSTYVNKVEPGRDIFAGDVRGGEGGTTKIPVQNQEQDKGLAEDEERIVSQVHGGGISAPPSEDDKPVVEEKNEDQKDEEKATQETLDNEGMDPIPPKDSKKEEKPGKPEGPLVEEDAAAEKVAQDLYPEEAD
ncbi:hypothetical protein K435DRAFT_186624 [Dendrothele bispora CBS 962.96]|uniref:Uncharacterized protein n=1 Tax=Dendrothele bispora (strain CBS 962.96) TaxID=1314807 RepID=A0A4S8MNE3_DENBC|nr:hypothetical protein K435DRAFT_186624 [Dendrothele bispora CBS 962.96]